MFKTAYLRLSMYYIAIIMAISLLFSVLLYNQAMGEVQAGLVAQTTKVLRGPSFLSIDPNALREFRQEQIDESRQHILLRLFYFNVLILIFGGVGSYLLAKRTMQPIQEAMESQSRFTADASHELRTPLTAMKTELEVALRDKNLTKPEAVELLQSNLEETNRLSALAEGLLMIAHRQQAVLEPVRLDMAVRTVIERLEALAAKKHIILRLELSMVTIKANQQDLEKIIGILLDNALKYSAEGTTVTLRVYQKSAAGTLEVSDHGQGIAAADLPYIFDRFYRADTARRKNDRAGYGLGLAIAQKLVQEQGGTIAVESKRNKGSTFRLRFPLLSKEKREGY